MNNCVYVFVRDNVPTDIKPNISHKTPARMYASIKNTTAVYITDTSSPTAMVMPKTTHGNIRKWFLCIKKKTFVRQVFLYILEVVHWITFNTPIIISVEIKIVIQRLTARIIFTTHDGSQSNRIVLNSTRAVNITISEAMASRIPKTPDIMEPVRNGMHLQQDDSNGAIILCQNENRYFILKI